MISENIVVLCSAYPYKDFSRTRMHKILLFLWLLPLSVFAESMDVTANIPSGTYHAPIHITLTPSIAGAKTFYSFKPDGTPNDAFLYTGSILLKHSTPFIYFSFVTTDNESKIKQNDYIIEYPGFVQFETDTIAGSGKIDTTLVNRGNETVDIGLWYVQSETDTIRIPEGTTLAPGAKYDIHLNYAGSSSIVLHSPDEDEKDILVVQESVVTPTERRPITTKVVPRKIISTLETAAPKPTPIKENTDSGMSLPPDSQISSPVPSINPAPVIPNSTSVDINQIAKASVNESGK